MTHSGDSTERLIERRNALQGRLDDGYARIGDAEIQGRDIAAWEQFWLALLGEYEAICEELYRMGER